MKIRVFYYKIIFMVLEQGPLANAQLFRITFYRFHIENNKC